MLGRAQNYGSQSTHMHAHGVTKIAALCMESVTKKAIGSVPDMSGTLDYPSGG